jgi:hypothetical protein
MLFSRFKLGSGQLKALTEKPVQPEDLPYDKQLPGLTGSAWEANFPGASSDVVQKHRERVARREATLRNEYLWSEDGQVHHLNPAGQRALLDSRTFAGGLLGKMRIRPTADDILANPGKYLRWSHDPSKALDKQVTSFTQNVLAPAAAATTLAGGALYGSGILERINPFAKKPPTLLEQVQQAGSHMLKSPYALPATIALGAGGLGVGYMGLNSLLDAARRRSRRRNLARAKERFESALQQEQHSKVGSALEEFISACEQRCAAKEADVTNTALSTIGLAGLAALALGLHSGYTSEPGSVRKMRELRRAREEQLAKRLARERRFKAVPSGEDSLLPPPPPQKVGHAGSVPILDHLGLAELVASCRD